MEGAQTYIVYAALLKRHKVGYHLDNVCCIHDSVYRRSVYHNL